MINEQLKRKLKTLPSQPGVYFHKDKNGKVIYVGKAAVLKNRVRQYFQNPEKKDSKTQALVKNIYDTDWITTDSEIDALFLESEMIKRYMPQFNILLRDDRSQIYIRINMKDDWPYVSFTRNPSDDGSEYYGPYYNSYAIRKAIRYLRRSFPFYDRPHSGGNRLSLNAQIGLEPAGLTSSEYHQDLRKLISYIKGDRQKIINELKHDMELAAREHRFEDAAVYRNRLFNLNELKKRIMFGDEEYLDISKDQALSDLTDLLGLKTEPRRIEGYDVSHMSGTNVVASMVVFTNGVSDRSQYRKFKTKIEQNNDFFNMAEIIKRRFTDENISKWGKPDLCLIDGGKGQLEAAIKVLNETKYHNVPIIGLAKKQEQIVIDLINSNVNLDKVKLETLQGYLDEFDNFVLINLPHDTHIIKLLQRIRDESHRFAISYHTLLKRKHQTSSIFDEIPGIGAKTKRKLIKKFGSVNGVKKVDLASLSMTVGADKAKKIKAFFNVSNNSEK